MPVEPVSVAPVVVRLRPVPRQVSPVPVAPPVLPVWLAVLVALAVLVVLVLPVWPAVLVVLAVSVAVLVVPVVAGGAGGVGERLPGCESRVAGANVDVGAELAPGPVAVVRKSST